MDFLCARREEQLDIYFLSLFAAFPRTTTILSASLFACVEFRCSVNASVSPGNVVAPAQDPSSAPALRKETSQRTISQVQPGRNDEVLVPHPPGQSLLVNQASLERREALVERANLLERLLPLAVSTSLERLLDFGDLLVKLRRGFLDFRDRFIESREVDGVRRSE